jgi:hypothetical protein
MVGRIGYITGWKAGDPAMTDVELVSVYLDGQLIGHIGHDVLASWGGRMVRDAAWTPVAEVPPPAFCIVRLADPDLGPTHRVVWVNEGSIGLVRVFRVPPT